MMRLKTLVTRPPRVATMLRVSAVLTLVGLALMVWSMLEPTPMPVILAMSVGQGLGVVALVLFGVSVLIDQVRKQRVKGRKMTTDEITAGEALLGSAPPNGATPVQREPASHEVSP
jgi:hypothetical protein